MTTKNKESASANDGFSLISNQKLLALYAAMIEYRGVAERERNHPQKSRSSLRIYSIQGHEAAVVGVAVDLRSGDTIAPALWPHPALKAINPSVSFASSISIASRSSLAKKDHHNVTVLFSSNQSSSRPSWQRALSRAATQNLPLLFVSFNRPLNANQPIENPQIAEKRSSYAFPSIAVDGNDVVAVYRVASEAIAHARKGHGPTLIDCLVLSPGDPIHNMMKYLIRKGLAPPENRRPTE
jgi:TPP-dependent pyruvate/acetoin dehydrogenase alpha subunit